MNSLGRKRHFGEHDYPARLFSGFLIQKTEKAVREVVVRFWA
jgi:hypothetical protein